MKLRYLLIPLLLFTGCSSVRYITLDHGQVINQNGSKVSFIGNPYVTCSGSNIENPVSGYFVYQEFNYFVIDEFGKHYDIVYDPRCVVNSN